MQTSDPASASSCPPTVPTVLSPIGVTDQGPGVAFRTTVDSGDIADVIVSGRRAEIRRLIGAADQQISLLRKSQDDAVELFNDSYASEIKEMVVRVRDVAPHILGCGIAESRLVRGVQHSASSDMIQPVRDGDPDACEVELVNALSAKEITEPVKPLSYSVGVRVTISFFGLGSPRSGDYIPWNADDALLASSVTGRKSPAEASPHMTHCVSVGPFSLSPRLRELVDAVRSALRALQDVVTYRAALAGELARLSDIRETLVAEMTRMSIRASGGGEAMLAQLESLVTAKFNLPALPGNTAPSQG